MSASVTAESLFAYAEPALLNRALANETVHAAKHIITGHNGSTWLQQACTAAMAVTDRTNIWTCALQGPEVAAGAL